MSSRPPAGEVSLSDLIRATKLLLKHHESICINCKVGIPCAQAKRYKKQIRDFELRQPSST